MLTEKQVKEIEEKYDLFREHGEIYLDPSKQKEFKLFDVVIGLSPTYIITPDCSDPLLEKRPES